MSNNLTSIAKLGAKFFGLLSIYFAPNVYAGSFQLHEQSTTYLGNAFSGTASTAEDASTGYYNPAGLTFLKNNQAVLSAVYYYGAIKLYDARATNNLGANVNANPKNRPASNSVIPGMHLSANINKCWSVGLGAVAPFGLNTKYSSSSNSIARYEATDSGIKTVDITPSIAFKVNDQISVGAGFDAMYVKATLDSAIFFGSEGFVNNEGDAWAYSYHVGALYQPTKETRMGLVYYSFYNAHLKGTVNVKNYPLTVPTTVTTNLYLPDRIVYSITHDYTDKWTGVADIEWMHWTRFKYILLVYNTGAESYIPLFHKNAYRVAFGVNYKHSKCLMLKGGVSFDQSPVRTQYRIAPLPDSDRYWFALGLKYAFNKNLVFDIAYAYLNFKQCAIQERTVTNGAVKQSLYGNYKNSADLLGVQLTWNFV